ncbi:MAG: D-aminoacyl-tRNA deacylase [Proteobacteria bacterium]|nr:D-aminoacyl-tRNA deacylase [Pseudomonadota bacterium]
MKAVIQRVSSASVHVDNREVSAIQKGYLILLGVSHEDDARDRDTLAAKIAKLRVFADEAGKMNLSITDVGGSILLVSQFTLCADARRGNRPAFTSAMAPQAACAMYQSFGQALSQLGIPVAYGEFGAMMNVSLVNDGPVTIILETRQGTLL